jgi:hypothetical protein
MRLAMPGSMRSLLALSLVVLTGGSAFANDLRDARNLATKLHQDPSKNRLGRTVRQRDRMAGADLTARRGEGGRIEVETWKSKGKVQTSTTRTFELVDGRLEHIMTESKLKHGKANAFGVDYFPTVERTQINTGKRMGESSTIVSVDQRTGKASVRYIDKPAPAP